MILGRLTSLVCYQFYRPRGKFPPHRMAGISQKAPAIRWTCLSLGMRYKILHGILCLWYHLHNSTDCSVFKTAHDPHPKFRRPAYNAQPV